MEANPNQSCTFLSIQVRIRLIFWCCILGLLSTEQVSIEVPSQLVNPCSWGIQWVQACLGHPSSSSCILEVSEEVILGCYSQSQAVWDLLAKQQPGEQFLEVIFSLWKGSVPELSCTLLNPGNIRLTLVLFCNLFTSSGKVSNKANLWEVHLRKFLPPNPGHQAWDFCWWSSQKSLNVKRRWFWRHDPNIERWTAESSTTSGLKVEGILFRRLQQPPWWSHQLQDNP